MSEIANLTGDTDSGNTYYQKASQYLVTWQNNGISKSADPPHTLLNYNNETSWGTYRMYENTLLDEERDFLNNLRKLTYLVLYRLVV
jgi:hypothetical protein